MHILPFLPLSGATAAANTIKYVNHCPYPLYSWTVGPATSSYTGADSSALTLPPNSTTASPLINGDDLGGGISLKLRDLPRYRVAPAGIIQVEYNLEASKSSLWYDFSAIDCNHAAAPEDPAFCPLIRSGVRVRVEGAKGGVCPEAGCGETGCWNTYEKPGTWVGEPTFKCEAGADIVVEFCTEKAGPRTFYGRDEQPGRAGAVEVTQGGRTVDGTCGVKSKDGATCFGFPHGNCCSEYGWCGFSNVHCGSGCQHGFGDCFGESPAVSSSYDSPAKPSSITSGYEKPTPSYSKPASSSFTPVASYSVPEPSYHAPPSSAQYSPPAHSSSAYASPPSSYGVPSYGVPSTTRPTTPGYSKPSPSQYHPVSSQSHPAGHYTMPSPSPSKSKSKSMSSSGYSAPLYTVYATHTVTITHGSVTETVYHVPTPTLSHKPDGYATPTHSGYA